MITRTNGLVERDKLLHFLVGQALGSYQMSPGEVAELMEYQAFVEAARAWGREQRAGLGL